VVAVGGQVFLEADAFLDGFGELVPVEKCGGFGAEEGFFELRAQGFEEVVLIVDDEDFAGFDAVEFGGQFAEFGEFGGAEIAGGDVGAGKAKGGVWGGGVGDDGGDEVRARGVQVVAVQDDTGGDDADDVAFDDAFGGAWIFELVADGDGV